MTDIFQTPEKVSMKRFLFQTGIQTLEKQGWTVERIQGTHKSSVRRISKGRQTFKVSIRTSQDTWFAFPRTKQDDSWRTLSEVDIVLVVSVDNGENPRFAKVHWLDARDVEQRFDRALGARIAAGRKISPGRGMWVSLYREEAADPAVLIGAGAGRDEATVLAQVPLPADIVDAQPDVRAADLRESNAGGNGRNTIPPGPTVRPSYEDESPLTILEAKRRLARYLGVDPSAIKITVEA
jgi:predicted RNA binding protein YcfA (HicA-like mRNA interferase family)